MRIGLAFWGTYQLDHNTFIAWGRKLSEVGYSQFYSTGWSDYLPGYLYALKFLAGIEQSFLIPTELLFKLPAIIADIVVAAIIYGAVKQNHKEKYALLASAVFLFNPAVFANSTLWGQVDILSSLFSLGSVVFLGNISSPIMLAIGGSIKPQAAMTLPILLALMLRNKWRVEKILTYVLTVALVFALIFLPFNGQGNLFLFIYDRIMVTLNQYPYGSVNAFNFWGLWGFWKSDLEGIITHKTIGNSIVIFFSIISFIKVYKDESKKYIALAFLFFVNFMFLTRMHERHLLPLFAPLAIAFIANNYYRIVYVITSITYGANLYYAYQFIDQNKHFYIPDSGVTLLILINLFAFGLLSYAFLFDKKSNYTVDWKKIINRLKSKKKEVFKKDLVTKQKSKKYVFILLGFALVTRLINLGYPPNDYFDEIYHAFTARAIVANDPKPWHWMSEHPEGYAYEWTHPPLAKEIMAASMKVIGVNHFAARLPGALLGVGIVFLTYKLSLELTKRRDISLIAMCAIATDGLIFTMSRIATADVYLVFFMMLTLLFLSQHRYSLSALALGLSVATKWSSVWILPVIVIFFISQRMPLKKTLASFVVVPPLVYLASYIPMFTHGYTLDTFWGMQKQMYWYHSNLVATHSYSSRWWSWPLNIRPVYLYQFDNRTGLLGNIYAMGNPVFFWLGVVAIIIAFYYVVKRSTPKAIALLLFSYLALFTPWSASPRIMFIYHYMPALPLMAIILGYILRRHRRFVIPFIILSFASFVYFYPHWTGMHIPEWLSSSYYWLKSWR